MCGKLQKKNQWGRVMTKIIEQTIAPYINVPMRLKQDDVLENILFFNYGKLSDEDKADIADYYLEDDVLESVISGELVPIAILGLTDNPDSYAEMSHAGILLWDLRKSSAKTEILFFNVNEDAELEIAADTFAQLPIQPVEQKSEPKEISSDIEELTSPAYCADWDKLILLYGQDKPLEALAIAEKLTALLPSSNIELMKMQALMLAEVERFEEALTVAEDIVIESLGNAAELEFAGRIQLKSKAYSKALETADRLFEWRGNDDNSKLRAAAHAIRGIAQFYTGDQSEAVKNLEQAKSLHSMVIVKYPEVGKLQG